MKDFIKIEKQVIKKIDKGIGDTISRAIKTISRGTIKECDGCIKRKETLNKIIPYNRD